MRVEGATPTAQAAPAPRFHALEPLRTLAAVFVIFFHIDIFHFPEITGRPIFRNSYVMVDFFFVLSGFVLSCGFYGRIERWSQVGAFMARRFLRLYPLHLVTLAAFVGIYAIIIGRGLSGYYWTGQIEPIEQDPTALISHLFLTQAITESGLTYNYVSWSISTEFYTYLLFALLLAATAVGRLRLALLIVGALGLGGYLWASGVVNATTGVAILRCVYGFAVGVLVERAQRRLGLWAPPALGLLAMIGAIALVGLTPPLSDAIYTLVFGVAIFLVASSREGALQRLSATRWGQGFGALSYGVYLWHPIVIWFTKLGLTAALGYEITADIYGGERLEGSLVEETAVVAFILAATFALAWATHRLIEAPVDRWRRRIAV